MKLTYPQTIVLRALGRASNPMSGPEISEATRNVREFSTPRLNQLEKLGFAERVGTTFQGVRCWQITDAGRAALETQEGGNEADH